VAESMGGGMLKLFTPCGPPQPPPPPPPPLPPSFTLPHTHTSLSSPPPPFLHHTTGIDSRFPPPGQGGGWGRRSEAQREGGEGVPTPPPHDFEQLVAAADLDAIDF